MTRHYPDLGSASNFPRGTTQIWVVRRHQYGIFALVSQTSFGGETSSSVARFRLFSQAMSSRVSAFVVPSGAHLMAVPESELGRVKLSYSKLKAKKNLTVSSLRDANVNLWR